MLDDLDQIERMYVSLLMIGYSWHSGLPRMGDKAQAARWGLGLKNEPLPESYRELLRNCVDDPTGIEGLEGLLT